MQTYRSIFCLRAILLLLLFSTSWVQLQAQSGSAAMPFLSLNNTPNELSLGGAFTALPSNSVFASWYNPAQLGYSTDYSLSFSYAPKSSWLTKDLAISNMGMRYQKNFPILGKNIELGVSIHQFQLSYSSIDITTIQNPDGGIGTMKPLDRSRSISFGLGSKIFSGIYVGFGYTIKQAFQEYDYTFNDVTEFPDYNRTAYASDYGLLARFDFTELVKKTHLFEPFPLEFSIGLGYAIKNVGDLIKIDVNGPSGFDAIYAPLPRTTQLGISFSFIAPQQLMNGNWIDFIRVDLSRETRDLRVDPTSSYQSFLKSDISFVDNFIYRETQNKVMIHDGMRLSLYETLELSLGSIIHEDSKKDKAFGFSINLAGFKKNYLDDHFPFIKPIALKFSYSEIDNYVFWKSYFWGFQIGYTF